ncbi:putative Transcription factor-related [Quillaja saponaria]|uniref:Transcription factor-related n=1 Tax=Quillaja saponaria TaxID=32244 RepID=A0AAD7M491_QUISA|nr:putative Transcription factor-related [Quillaja saponaria]
MKSQVEEKFCEYFEKWMSKLEDILHQLLMVSKERSTTATTLTSSDAELKALVSKMTTHFKEYYTVKWASAHEDVLAFFCSVWLSPLENAYSWVTGWKPSMAFKLLDSLKKKRVLVDMTEEQERKINELRLKIKFDEEKVEREMERQQMAIAERKMVELGRLATRVRKGDDGLSGRVDGLVEVAFKAMLVGLEKVMKAADCVRLKTLKGVLDVLSPLQCVEFLAAICMLQIQLRHASDSAKATGKQKQR